MAVLDFFVWPEVNKKVLIHCTCLLESSVNTLLSLQVKTHPRATNLVELRAKILQAWDELDPEAIRMAAQSLRDRSLAIKAAHGDYPRY